MQTKTRRRLRKFGFAILFSFLLLNLAAITQAYHLTHFYEHGTVNSISDQTSNIWGQIKVALIGLKQEKLVGALPDSAYTSIRLKTVDGLMLDAWSIKVVHPKGTVVIFHGHGSEKSANLSQSNTFNQFGFSTLLVDFRAHGQSGGVISRLTQGRQLGAAARASGRRAGG